MDLNIHPPLPCRKDFRIGILGSGFIVDECHLVAYRKAGFNPVAIASLNRDNAAKVAAKHNIPKVHVSYESLLDDPSIEVLDIAVPPNALLPLIQKACAQKTVKGILAQKPLGMNYGEALAIVGLCESAGITLAVNQNMRFDQSVRAAKTLLGDGTIGEPILATIEMRGIPHWQPWQAELGWATLRIMSIHHLDTFRYWFGSPQRIFCSTRPDPRTQFPHADGICTYILEYASGLRCIAIDDTWTGPAKEGCPSDNYIKWRIEGLNGLAIGDIGWCKNPYTTPSTIRYAKIGQQDFQCPTWPESWFPDAFIGTMADLLIALEEKRDATISGHDNLKTMDLVDAAYQSTEAHLALEIDQSKGAKSWRFLTPAMATSNAATNTPSNFSPRAQQLLAFSRREAAHLNHNFVGTEHLLLAITSLGQGEACKALARLGLNLDRLREEVEKHIGTGPDARMIGNIPYTPRVKKVLALAAKEAIRMNHTYVGTEHILMGLLLEGDGVAARVLKNLNIQVDSLRQEILKEPDPMLESAQIESSREKPRTGEPATVESLGEPKPKWWDIPGQFKAAIAEAKNDSGLNNFTPRAQQVLASARKEADRLNHKFVATEHVLLGLITLGQGVAFNVLQKRGVNLDAARREVEKQVGTGADQKIIGNIPYTPRVKKVLALAAKEAMNLNHTYVGTEHILLGLLRESDGVATRVLKNLHVDIEQTRLEILEELYPNFNPPKQ